MSPFACRPGCAACCIAPSISTPLPGQPGGKAAGEDCPLLDAAGRCVLFGKPERPPVCVSLRPCPEMCGSSRGEALAILSALELATTPAGAASREPAGEGA